MKARKTASLQERKDAGRCDGRDVVEFFVASGRRSSAASRFERSVLQVSIRPSRSNNWLSEEVNDHISYSGEGGGSSFCSRGPKKSTPPVREILHFGNLDAFHVLMDLRSRPSADIVRNDIHPSSVGLPWQPKRAIALLLEGRGTDPETHPIQKTTAQVDNTLRILISASRFSAICH